MCVSVSVWGEEKIEGHGRYLKNINYIYIYIYECKWVCAVRKPKKKKKNKLAFSKWMKHSARRRKTISSKENFLI